MRGGFHRLSGDRALWRQPRAGGIHLRHIGKFEQQCELDRRNQWQHERRQRRLDNNGRHRGIIDDGRKLRRIGHFLLIVLPRLHTLFLAIRQHDNNAIILIAVVVFFRIIVLFLIVVILRNILVDWIFSFILLFFFLILIRSFLLLFPASVAVHRYGREQGIVASPYHCGHTRADPVRAYVRCDRIDDGLCASRSRYPMLSRSATG